MYLLDLTIFYNKKKVELQINVILYKSYIVCYHFIIMISSKLNSFSFFVSPVKFNDLTITSIFRYMIFLFTEKH